jgi:hypothetical protein
MYAKPELTLLGDAASVVLGVPDLEVQDIGGGPDERFDPLEVD